MRWKRVQKSQLGVTLIELLIVLSLVAILLGAVLALGNKVVGVQRVNSAASSLGMLIENINDVWLPDATGARDFSTLPYTPATCDDTTANDGISAALVACMNLAPSYMIDRTNLRVRNAWGRQITFSAVDTNTALYRIVYAAGIPQGDCVKFVIAVKDIGGITTISSSGATIGFSGDGEDFDSTPVNLVSALTLQQALTLCNSSALTFFVLAD